MVRHTNTGRLNSIRGRERWWCEAENRGRRTGILESSANSLGGATYFKEGEVGTGVSGTAALGTGGSGSGTVREMRQWHSSHSVRERKAQRDSRSQ